jgi:predicted AlkP superfamily pyrophosphatase or phosphodiesterase
MVRTFSVVFAEHAADGPAVILISIDGFRWDYLNRNVTPNLQSLITSGVSAPCMRLLSAW